MPKSRESSKQRTTISIDKEILRQFKEYCKERGMKLSPKIEIYMAYEIKKNEKQKKE